AGLAVDDLDPHVGAARAGEAVGERGLALRVEEGVLRGRRGAAELELVGLRDRVDDLDRARGLRLAGERIDHARITGDGLAGNRGDHALLGDLQRLHLDDPVLARETDLLDAAEALAGELDLRALGHLAQAGAVL